MDELFFNIFLLHGFWKISFNFILLSWCVCIKYLVWIQNKWYFVTQIDSTSLKFTWTKSLIGPPLSCPEAKVSFLLSPLKEFVKISFSHTYILDPLSEAGPSQDTFCIPRTLLVDRGIRLGPAKHVSKIRNGQKKSIRHVTNFKNYSHTKQAS